MTELARDIRATLVSEDLGSLLELMVRNVDTELAEPDILELLRPCPTFEPPSKECFCITGSGGSGITKPNIGSLCALYLAASDTVDVTKLGSRRVHSSCGCIDFFDAVGVTLEGFQVVDTPRLRIIEAAREFPWRRARALLELNHNIATYLSDRNVNDFEMRSKLMGMMSQETANMYRARPHTTNPPQVLFQACGAISSRKIDELVPSYYSWHDGRNWQSGGTHSALDSDLTDQDPHVTNIDLLEGRCYGSFWWDSLSITFAVASLCCGVVRTIEAGFDMFLQLDRDRAAIRYLGDCQ